MKKTGQSRYRGFHPKGASSTIFKKNYDLLGGVCMAALALAFTIPAARAASFSASNETELYRAIEDAQTSPDATSTITQVSKLV